MTGSPHGPQHEDDDAPTTAVPVGDRSEADTPTHAVPAPPGQGAAPEPTEPAVELAPGSTIGARYRLTSLVGTDVQGNRFWRARDSVLPRDMAITLLPDSSGTSATVARTLRAGRLRHIGLPQTLDLGTEHGQTFVVGQWVDGASLLDLIARGPLEPAVASAIGGRIAEAVAEAHRNGLALGSINPALVRVNVDGQARFSHVIAHATASPDDDIRAVGGLLYLMVTGTWPTSDALPPLSGSSVPTAPSRNGRELPAREVAPDVPNALSRLITRALHPEDRDGIHAIGAMSTLLQTPDPSVTSQPLSGTPTAEPEQPPPTMSPADRRLRKERRLKIGIAGMFLAAFVALILIVVGTLARNTFASINDQNKNLLDPLQDRPSTSVVPTTAKNSPPATSPGASTPAPTTPGSTAPSSSAAPAQQVQIVGASVYDPEGTGKRDNVDFLDRLWDGDPNTDWETWVYKQQFRAEAQGGFKIGVGVVLQFDRPVTPQTVEIVSGQTGMTVQIRTATGLEPGPFDSTQLLATGDVAGGPVVIPVANAPKSQYLLVFLTQIPGSGNAYKGQIGEIVVKGS